MPKKIILLLYGALASTLVSCTSVLFVDATKPPAVAVTNEQWKVAVINRFNPALLDFNQEKKVEVFADGANHAFLGAIDAVLQEDTYDLVFTDSISYRTPTFNGKLSPVQVQELYMQQPHHLLLSLEHFDTYFKQETVREEEEDGSVSKTAFYDLAVASTWVLYDSTGQVLDRFILAEEAPYQSRTVLSGLLAIGPSMGNAGAAVNDLAWRTGNRYWSRLSPQPVSFARPYYSSQSFFAASTAMATGNWENALALLEPLTQSSNKKEAARASYNMAVVYEAMGDIAQAKYWAKEAMSRKEKLAAILLPELEKY
ncbi:DUF6340 family protein [Pontibacter litorisediminis]|uniref:DUF6340 family protein n=1 Tax=Pontibacter litorisediminis TaxID=1846260 RepID=UPI0023EAC23A|nr:DUF6340 family protein [Pontibacter litorisediminis]